MLDLSILGDFINGIAIHGDVAALLFYQQLKAADLTMYRKNVCSDLKTKKILSRRRRKSFQHRLTTGSGADKARTSQAQKALLHKTCNMWIYYKHTALCMCLGVVCILGMILCTYTTNHRDNLRKLDSDKIRLLQHMTLAIPCERQGCNALREEYEGDWLR